VGFCGYGDPVGIHTGFSVGMGWVRDRNSVPTAALLAADAGDRSCRVESCMCWSVANRVVLATGKDWRSAAGISRRHRHHAQRRPHRRQGTPKAIELQLIAHRVSMVPATPLSHQASK